ncbi:hypothetical protein FG379_002142 [Cryptosporidium bovis]|uniref:uncharacterized protein n=1 Tax=Cryptosporidium bovis TaxID=310047 RepID=UPI00351AAB68|nr:hypothetical protein FG379_002142 [Cryptosporidium bovis]
MVKTKSNRKIITILYLFLIFLKISIIKIYAEETILFTSRILRLCKDYDKLTKSQLIQLESWIDEVIATKVLSFNTKYNLKSCKKKIRSKHKGVSGGTKLKSKEFVETNRVYNKLSRLFKRFKNEIALSTLTINQFDKLQKKSVDKELFSSKIDQLLKNKDSLSDNIFFDDALDLEYNKSPENELIGDDDQLLHEGIRVSDYFDKDGNPIIVEAERFKLTHRCVDLYIPTEMPLFFTYSRTQKYLLDEQPSEIKIFDFYSKGKSKILISDLGENIQETSSYYQKESEIIDKSNDGFDNSATIYSTESETVDESSLFTSNDGTRRGYSTSQEKSDYDSFQGDTGTLSETQDGREKTVETKSTYESETETEYSNESRTSGSRRSSGSSDYSDESSSREVFESSDNTSDESVSGTSCESDVGTNSGFYNE